MTQELILAMAFIFLALWFVLKLATDRIRNQNPQPPRPPRPLMRPDARPAPLERPPGGGAAVDLREEVAEFLRRAQQRRMEQAPRPKGVPPAERPERRPRPPQRPVSRGPARPPTVAPAPPPLRPEILPSARTQAEGLARRGIGQPLKPLEGSELSQRHLETHIADPYAHPVGTLASTSVSDTMVSGTAGTTSESPSEAPTSAGGIVDLLRGGDRLRQIIILNEVLQRPVQRWD
jgi:hypothetical protein